MKSRRGTETDNHRDKRAKLAGESRRAEGQKGMGCVSVLGEGLGHNALSRNWLISLGYLFVTAVSSCPSDLQTPPSV